MKTKILRMLRSEAESMYSVIKLSSKEYEVKGIPGLFISEYYSTLKQAKERCDSYRRTHILRRISKLRLKKAKRVY